ncbi:MAG: acyl carrier protein [Oscillospiraceae bacterium]|jgi:acyl carrier protein|nr:acyl carrier protein [Oscillospiraceae bacterium]
MIFETVKRMLSELFFVEEDEISLETSFVKDLEADSLDLVDLVMAIEDEFGIEVLDDDVKSINTAGDLVEYISRASRG